MQNTQKESKTSGKVQLGLLLAVALVAGGAGVWSEVKAGPAARTAGSNIDIFGTSSTVGSDGVELGNDIGGYIHENGDGTAEVNVYDQVYQVIDAGDGWIGYQLLYAIYAFDTANTTYTQVVDIKPGQSGNQTGSGAGIATLAGEYFDYATWESTPVTVSLQLGVSSATDDVSAFNNHTLDVHTDFVTGEVTTARRVSIGTGAYGETAGSFALTVDGVPYDSAEGIVGHVQALQNVSVTRIQ